MSKPILDQVNIIVSDMEASVKFYRSLGVEIPDTHPAWQHHHRTASSQGLDIDFDSQEFAKKWNSGASGTSANSTVLGFRLPTREAVDETYRRTIAAGYCAQQEPYDAFWGSRYAIVQDPDGNPVGLMSPPESSRRTPPVPPG